MLMLVRYHSIKVHYFTHKRRLAYERESNLSRVWFLLTTLVFLGSYIVASCCIRYLRPDIHGCRVSWSLLTEVVIAILFVIWAGVSWMMSAAALCHV